jgi:hypothetical protein
MLEEFGAVPDTLGMTPGRESLFNSDRRLADIYVNNLGQNESITGFDRFAHPWATTASEIAGGFVVPAGRVRTAADLGKFGAAYGAIAGLGQDGTIPERLNSGVVGAGEGLATTVLGGKALEAAVKNAPRLGQYLSSRLRPRAPETPAGEIGGVREETVQSGNDESLPSRSEADINAAQRQAMADHLVREDISASRIAPRSPPATPSLKVTLPLIH